MKMSLRILIAVLLGVGLALILTHDNGYVLLHWGSWSLESTMPVFFLGIITLSILLVLGWLIALGTLGLPTRLFKFRQRRVQERGRQNLVRGLTDLHEGRWRNAERTLLRQANYSDTPLLHFLLAARAARLQGADDRSSQHLKKALESTPAATTAVMIAEAELMLADHQYDKALSALQNLPAKEAKNAQRIKILRRCYEALHEWSKLKDLLSPLREQKILPVAEYERLAVKTYTELFRRAGMHQNIAQLDSLWRELHKPLRQQPEILHAYVVALREVGEPGQAETIITGYLDQRWSEDLALDYGLLEIGDPDVRRKKLDDWTKKHGQQPALLLSAARVCLLGKHIDQARQYLESSINLAARPESYRELGRLFETQGQHDKARAAYHAGLELSLQRYGRLDGAIT